MIGGSVVTLLVAAGVVGTLGVLIKYFERVELIAGYDPDRVTDEEALADFIGTNTLAVAVLLLIVAAVEHTAPFGGEAVQIGWIVLVVGVLLLCVRMIVGARRYEDEDHGDAAAVDR
ncbi:DUF3784 domain-containing protein [Natrialbaceae archaeon A-arb3/5]